MKTFKGIAAVLIFTLGSSQALGASISMVYTGPNDIGDDGLVFAEVGELVEFDLVADFSDSPTLGGGFDLIFDSNVLQFENYQPTSLGDAKFARGPDVLDGLLYSMAFGDFAGISGPGVVASVSFTVLTGMPTAMMLSGTDGPGGPFVSAEDFVSILDVDYSGIRLNMPLPATVWFLLSGIGALAALRRR